MALTSLNNSLMMKMMKMVMVFIFLFSSVNRNRLGSSGSQGRTKPPSPTKVKDVRLLLEEKRHGQRQRSPLANSGKAGVRSCLCVHILSSFPRFSSSLNFPSFLVGRRSAATRKETSLPRQNSLALTLALTLSSQRRSPSQRASQRHSPQTGRVQSGQPKNFLQFLQRQEDKYVKKTSIRSFYHITPDMF